MDQTKIDTVLNWKTPKNLKDVQRFLGFANFYRRFIRIYSSIAVPLTALTQKDMPFFWTPVANDAFSLLKQAFTTASVLLHLDFTKPFTLETDASDFVLGAVLSQADTQGVLHPVEFQSRKFSPQEINYEIHDKELLAIIDAFTVWRHYLVGAQHPINVFTDHQNLRYFMTTRTLNRRQARWSIFLSDFNFVIILLKGYE